MKDRTQSMMNAVTIDRFGPPDVMAMGTLPLPEVGAYEVLVRLSAAGINPKDVLVRKGKFRLFTGRRFPMQLGYDFSGVVDLLTRKAWVWDESAGVSGYRMCGLRGSDGAAGVSVR